MVGDIIGALTDTTSAEDAVTLLGRPDLLARVHAASQAEGVQIGPLVAAKVRHMVEKGSEDISLDLVGVMAGSPQPGAAAVERALAYAFPPATRVRITRNTP